MWLRPLSCAALQAFCEIFLPALLWVVMLSCLYPRKNRFGNGFCCYYTKIRFSARGPAGSWPRGRRERRRAAHEQYPVSMSIEGYLSIFIPIQKKVLPQPHALLRGDRLHRGEPLGEPEVPLPPGVVREIVII